MSRSQPRQKRIASRIPIERLELRQLLSSTHFAVVGDFGADTPGELSVANLIKSWNPDYITTLGDNNYDTGQASTIDRNIGKYYHEFILNYLGTYGGGSPTQRFYPTLGNHDWGNKIPNPNGANPYLAYFDLPGNERYYDFVKGPVHFFMIDSYGDEPDGNTAGSVQGQWLQAGLASATEPFKLVMFHHPSYSSGTHGSTSNMQWPFKQWGATAVLMGHEHDYERLSIDGLPYLVNGIGGADLRGFTHAIPGSQVRYSADFGAMLVDATDSLITFKEYSASGALVDQLSITGTGGPTLPDVAINATDPTASEIGPSSGTVRFSRSGPTTADLVLSLSITGSATNGVDYATLPTTITIPAGSATTSFTINPIADGLVEGSENVIVNINPSATYQITSANSATVTISDQFIANTGLVPAGSDWHYLDDGSAQDPSWLFNDFDDSGWAHGPAQLGYGEGDESTVVGYGPDASNKYITTYFRHTFNINDPTLIDGLNLRLLCDDGARVFLNAQLVYSFNMSPDGIVFYFSPADTDINGAAENTWTQVMLDSGLLVQGLNVVAVELHQSSVTSDDVSFDLELQAATDLQAPGAPSKPDLLAADDSGVLDNDNITNVSAPRFFGTAEEGVTVRLYIDGVFAGTDVATGGVYAIASTISLADGTHNVTAAATDAASNTGPQSPALSVLIDTIAPTIVSRQFVYDAPRMHIDWFISEDIGQSQDNFDPQLHNLTTATVIPDSKIAIVYTITSNVATFTFPGYLNGILPDGNYNVEFDPDGVTDLAGNQLPATNTFYDFFFLDGDANRDKKIDSLDFNALASNFGLTGRLFSEGDFSYDGKTDSLDFNALATRFGTSLPAPATVQAVRPPVVSTIDRSFHPHLLGPLRDDILS